MRPAKTLPDLLGPALKNKVLSLRREIHKNPELSLQEKNTQKIILRELSKIGVRGRKICRTGVTATLPGASGKTSGKVLMLRADMDALPIEEEVESVFKSRNKGVMHACGHDGHVAMLLTAASLLKEKPVGGPVKLCFQPAEEKGIGAKAMIEDGILENPEVGAAFAIHLWAGIPIGKMGIVLGPCMAAVDEFEIKIKGKGGHAAYPHHSIDSIYIASQTVLALQSIVGRNYDPVDTAVVTVGSIHGGTTYNIIPPEVDLMGTCRTFSDYGRKLVKKRLHEIVKGTAKTYGGTAEIIFDQVLGATVNDKKMCTVMWDAGVRVLGKKNVFEDKPMMGGEDMGLYLKKVPGCFAFLGMQNAKKGAKYPHHHPKFSMDEDALPLGVEILYRVAELYYKQ